MAIADSFIPELKHEMATTRSLLERVPDHLGNWKPHPKSMSMGELAQHIATLPFWATMTLSAREFDVNPADGEKFAPPRWESAAKALATFDQSVAAASEAIATASDTTMMESWTLKNGGQVVISLPRAGVLRSFVLSHTIHHRGQLSVYLRLNDIPLPSIYGPTADMS